MPPRGARGAAAGYQRAHRSDDYCCTKQVLCRVLGVVLLCRAQGPARMPGAPRE